MERVKFDIYYKKNLNNLLFRWVDRNKIKIINSVLAREKINNKIIDLGSGSGTIASKLKGEITCVDYDDDLLEMCHVKSMITIKADLEKRLPFEDGYANCVLSIDSIEHLKNPDYFLKEIKRITRKGGICIIFTPRYDSNRWILAEKFHYFVTKQVSDHISPFTKESFERRLSSFFEDFRIGTTNFNMSLYAVIRI